MYTELREQEGKVLDHWKDYTDGVKTSVKMLGFIKDIWNHNEFFTVIDEQ